MNSSNQVMDILGAHKSPPAGMVFHDSQDSVWNDPGLLSYWSVIDRAWVELKLNGVLCLNGRPILYLKKFDRPFSSNERIRLQRLFWNQGVANILVLADPNNVYIYSGLATPYQDFSNEEVQEKSLVEILSLVEYVLRIQTFFHGLATGHYYEKNQEWFDQEQSVDSWLIDNLRALRNKLTQGDKRLRTKEAHAFIGRVLFLCYLLDRKIYSVGEPSRNQTGTMMFVQQLMNESPASRIAYLYGIFNELKNKFNGNMFDQDLETEQDLIKSNHIDTLIDFLRGHKIEKKQLSLGFWAYDFKMIPVETISAIYQDFLGAEDQSKQRKRGAIYTPRFLAEMVVDTIFKNELEAHNWTFLDPSCGSGIFLVILFNRLVNRWLHMQSGRIHYTMKAKALQEILSRQIRGVDIEETACRIACFSLYLAYLDFFDPPDINEYIEKTGRPLPKLLSHMDDPIPPEVDIPVIHHADFISGDAMSGMEFDCIIGNPPWVDRGNRQLAQKFMEVAPDYLKPGGVGCLLLPVKIIQNQTDKFQKKWLRRVTLEKIINLADFSFLLFKNALCPAFIARFTNTPPNPNEHYVELNAPKFSRDGLRQGIITVNPTDRKWIPLVDVLLGAQKKIAPVVWKRRLWGTARDQKLLDLLMAMPRLSDLAGRPKEGKRWIKGQGFKPYYPSRAKLDPNYPEPKPHSWSLDMPYADAKKDFYINVLQIDCIKLGEKLEKINAAKDAMYRVPFIDLFVHPMVLASQGFGKTAYCDFDVIFQHSLQSIAGPPEDADLLMFLAVYLRSSLARYFLFHTAGNWGSERDKVHLEELLRVPFPLPEQEHMADNAGIIVAEIVRLFKKLRDALERTFADLKVDPTSQSLLGDSDEDEIKKQWAIIRKSKVDDLQDKCEPLIFQYFGLTPQEVILVEDTIRVFEPSSTPTTWWSPQTVTLEPVHHSNVEPYVSKGLSAYADTLTETLNGWAREEGSHHRVYAEGGIDEQTGLAVVTVKLSEIEKPFSHINLSTSIVGILSELHGSASKKNGRLIYQRDIFTFHKGGIHIARPNILFNWTRTAALNDAARIYEEIVMADGTPDEHRI